MRHVSPPAEPTFGFLTSLESPEHGYFGGYLIASLLGRPVEFHCTSPVKPSRAQEILYGPTLQPYLLGEQIAVALVQAAKLTPRLILTDQATMLLARVLANAPMALLLDGSELSVASSGSSRLSTVDGRFALGDCGLQMPAGFESEISAVSETAATLAEHIDLIEPFGRIHEAIREAQRIGGRAAESHGEAA
jgi:hypothetical protein